MKNALVAALVSAAVAAGVAGAQSDSPPPPPPPLAPGVVYTARHLSYDDHEAQYQIQRLSWWVIELRDRIAALEAAAKVTQP